MLTLLALFACTTKADPCGAGLGRADDGNCYPLATDDTGTPDSGNGDSGKTDTDADTDADSDSDTDADSDTDTDTDTDTSSSPAVTVMGDFTYEGDDMESDAVCNVTAWEEAAIDTTTNMPDHMNYVPLSQAAITCPTVSGTPVEYSSMLTISTHTRIAVVGFIDPDGDASTPEDVGEVNSGAGVFDVEANGTYPAVDIVIRQRDDVDTGVTGP